MALLGLAFVAQHKLVNLTKISKSSSYGAKKNTDSAEKKKD
jgi:hypothetical protein